MGTECKTPVIRELSVGVRQQRKLHEITPELATEHLEVSKPGFLPLKESALLDALRCRFGGELEWYREVNPSPLYMGAEGFFIFIFIFYKEE